MDFFERQEKAHHNTRLLVFYFVVGVALLIIAIYLAVSLAFVGMNSHHHRFYFESQRHISLWNPQLFFGVTVGTLAVILIGSVFRTMELSRGGSAVAAMMGGRLVNSNTTDPDERKLLNVVEEMALASGVPVPQVYVMDDEKGINAFAAGHSTSDAAVCATRGCMKLLTRDELQGVIGHEFSHILNGDMRLNMRLMGIIFGILCLTIIGRILLRARGRKNPMPLLGLILILLGWIGVFFGRLIQAAVSRQREFLADASSVQFTRNPVGLSRALQKIGGLAYGSKLESAHADEASHMFFGNGVREPFFGWLATHPPLEERIRAIDPGFDGKYPRVAIAELDDLALPASKKQTRSPVPIPFPLPGFPPAQSRSGLVPPVITAHAVLPSLGAPSNEHLRYAVELRDAFTPAVQNAARDSLGASALVYALLLSSEQEIRARQLQLLGVISASAREETERLLPEITSIATRTKLSLIDLALPALRHFSRIQYEQFNQAIQQLIDADGEIDLFEYVLQKVVRRHLEPQFKGARKPVIQYYALRPLAGDCAVLLSALAHLSSDDTAECERAFTQGTQNLSYYAQAPMTYVPSDQCDLTQVDAALNRLSQAVPQIKKNLLNACAQTVAADGVIQEMEAELLRAIADMLDCPIPPFVQPKEAAVPVS